LLCIELDCDDCKCVLVIEAGAMAGVLGFSSTYTSVP
jgi:hypothetical protein